MFRRTLLIFDDWIYGTGSINTPEAVSGLYGLYDLMSLEAVVDQLDADGTYIAHIWHSADARHWVAKKYPYGSRRRGA